MAYLGHFPADHPDHPHRTPRIMVRPGNVKSLSNQNLMGQPAGRVPGAPEQAIPNDGSAEIEGQPK